MGCLSSKSKQSDSRVNNDDKAIAEVKLTRDKVKNYLKKLESTISSLKLAVTDCIKTKQKSKALLVLRKQKYLEKNLETGNGELLNLETIIINIENAKIQKNVFDALKQGNDYLKQINSQLSINDVDKLMQETNEAIEYQQMVGEALARQEGIQFDEDQLVKELENLEVDEYQIPEVPKKKKHKHKEREEQGKEEEEEEDEMHREVQLNYA